IGAAPSGPVLIVGTGVPSLHAAHAHAAVDDLESGCDLSVGPAADGGWYLVGVRQPQRDFFMAATLGDAFAAIVAGGLRLGMLRSERVLADRSDAEALLADPLARPDIVRLLR